MCCSLSANRLDLKAARAYGQGYAWLTHDIGASRSPQGTAFRSGFAVIGPAFIGRNAFTRMAEIRRIYDREGAGVAALWDRMCQETPDGGPLSEQGRRNIARMLDMSAWHHATFCLVAIDDGQTVGFVNGRVDPGDGLLPCPAGEIDSLYVVPESRGRGLSRELAEAAVSWLRDRDAGTIYTHVCADAEDVRRFWQSLGFEADMVHLSLYRE